MKTKNEILGAVSDENPRYIELTWDIIGIRPSEAATAMDIFAKQQAIEFGKYMYIKSKVWSLNDIKSAYEEFLEFLKEQKEQK